MSLLSSPIKSEVIIVADASVVINLNATGRVPEVIKALANKFTVTMNTNSELERGKSNGHEDYQKLQALFNVGLVDLVGLGDIGTSIYASLVEGAASRTLDDGEAATISYAIEVGGIAVIDERKARNLCSVRFPDLQLLSTIDLLLCENVGGVLGKQGQIDAITRALQFARMRVPPDQVERVIAIIGEQNAALCKSLPKIGRPQYGGVALRR